MDPNGNVILVVEGDQGEGFKDPWEKKGDRGIKESSFEELIEEQMEEAVDEKQPDAQPRRPFPKMRMKKGMRIHFYGYSYKVTAVRPNGKITLRFDGLWKDKPQT